MMELGHRIATATGTATATAARPHFQALKMAPSDLKYPLFLFRAFSLLNFNFVASLCHLAQNSSWKLVSNQEPTRQPLSGGGEWWGGGGDDLQMGHYACIMNA